MRLRMLCLLMGTVACSSLPDAGGGVVALEVLTPDSLALSKGESLTLQARALDVHGELVATAEIFWRTSDTAAITLDTVRGVVTSLSDTAGIAHVQASVGTLLSTAVPIPLRATVSGIRRSE